MPIVEANVEQVWWARQSAKGVPATSAFKLGRKVAGALPQTNMTYGSENYSDGRRFATASDFVDTIQGSGAPAIQAQSGVFAHLVYCMFGNTDSTAGTGPYTHTLTPGSSSFWMTWWKKLGSSIVMRERYDDCKITQLVLEGSSGQKVLRATPTIISLNPGVITDADQAKADDGTEPLNYNQCEGSFKIDGVTVRGHSAFTITITDDSNPFRGDSPYAIDLAPGRGQITLNATILLDQTGLERFYSIYYGTATPSSGSVPTTTVPALGTYEFTATASANEYIKVSFAGVRWSPPDAPDGSPEGGAITLGLTGGARISGAEPMIEVEVKNADAQYT